MRCTPCAGIGAACLLLALSMALSFLIPLLHKEPELPTPTLFSSTQVWMPPRSAAELRALAQKRLLSKALGRRLSGWLNLTAADWPPPPPSRHARAKSVLEALNASDSHTTLSTSTDGQQLIATVVYGSVHTGALRIDARSPPHGARRRAVVEVYRRPLPPLVERAQPTIGTPPAAAAAGGAHSSNSSASGAGAAGAGGGRPSEPQSIWSAGAGRGGAAPAPTRIVEGDWTLCHRSTLPTEVELRDARYALIYRTLYKDPCCEFLLRSLLLSLPGDAIWCSDDGGTTSVVYRTRAGGGEASSELRVRVYDAALAGRPDGCPGISNCSLLNDDGSQVHKDPPCCAQYSLSKSLLLIPQVMLASRPPATPTATASGARPRWRGRSSTSRYI